MIAQTFVFFMELSIKMELVAASVAAVGTAYSYYQMSKLEQELEGGVQQLPIGICNLASVAAPHQASITQCGSVPMEVEACAIQEREAAVPCGKKVCAMAARPPPQCKIPRQMRSTTMQQRCQPAMKKNPRQATAPRLSRVTKPKNRTPAAASGCAPACRRGKITKNAFLNFVREVRATRCGHRQADIVQEAGCRWRCMTCEEKARYSRDAVVGRR